MTDRSNRISALVWRKSRASQATGECVEVAQLGPLVLVRDSRDPLGSPVELTPAGWRRLLTSVRNGDFDVA
jgi:hypothetical protein